MKKILTIFSLFILTSCTVSETAFRGASFIDFSRYENFYLSQSPSADFKFVPLGMVTSLAISGYEKNKIKQVPQEKNTKKNYDDIYTNQDSKMNYYSSTAQDAIDLLHKKALEIGANGILNIKVDYMPSSTTQGYSASGMAIKKE